jgi:isoleucyl-tRNA synthetase
MISISTLYVRLLADFCNEDLSAFFFDIRKDCLYCDAPDSRSALIALDLSHAAPVLRRRTLFHACWCRYAARVLVFTAEEVWVP